MKAFISSRTPKGVTYIGRVKPQRFESIAHLTDQIQKIICRIFANTLDARASS
jgi:hypothetical protein